MKTIQELYDEIMANGNLKAQFIEAARAGKQEAFLKEQGCEATMEEVSAFLKAKSQGDAPLSLDELDNAAGGTCNRKTAQEAAVSFVGIAGIACLGSVLISIAGSGQALAPVSPQSPHAGQLNENEGRLCNR